MHFGVVLGQHGTRLAGPVSDRPLAYLASHDRKARNGHRETRRSRFTHHYLSCQVCVGCQHSGVIESDFLGSSSNRFAEHSATYTTLVDKLLVKWIRSLESPRTEYEVSPVRPPPGRKDAGDAAQRLFAAVRGGTARSLG
jgi:hypothetical protein